MLMINFFNIFVIYYSDYIIRIIYYFLLIVFLNAKKNLSII